MKVRPGDIPWKGPFPFTLNGVRNARSAIAKSDRPGVYQVLYMGERVYIGVSSVSVFDRLRKHITGRGNKGLSQRTQHDLYEFMYWLCDAESALQIESHITVNRKPQLNDKIEYVNYLANITFH